MIHFFLDIDGTISETLHPSLTFITPELIRNKELTGEYPVDLVEAIGCQNLVYPGAKELIKYLQSIKGATFSYFSAGTKERNEALVANLHAMLEAPVPKIYSRDDIKAVQIKLHREKRMIYPKPIHTLVRKKDFRNTVLIDDNIFSIPKGKKRNLLHVPPGNFNIQSIRFFRSSEDHLYKQTDPFQTNNKVFYIAGVLARALEIKKTIKKISFTSALAKAIDFKNKFKLSYFERGLDVLRQFNSELSFYMPSTVDLEKSKAAKLDQEQQVDQAKSIDKFVPPIPESQFLPYFKTRNNPSGSLLELKMPIFCQSTRLPVFKHLSQEPKGEDAETPRSTTAPEIISPKFKRVTMVDLEKLEEQVSSLTLKTTHGF